MSSDLRILIVDDSAVMRAMIRRALALATGGAELFEAANGQEAIALLERQAIDAVFTDLNMPVMSGIDLLREMNARGWTHIPRVIVSTDGSDARREEARELQVELYVNKPFEPEVIRDVIAKISPRATAAC